MRYSKDLEQRIDYAFFSQLVIIMEATYRENTDVADKEMPHIMRYLHNHSAHIWDGTATLDSLEQLFMLKLSRFAGTLRGAELTRKDFGKDDFQEWATETAANIMSAIRKHSAKLY